MLLLVSMWGIAFTLSYMLQCGSPRNSYDNTSGKCIDPVKFNNAACTSTIVLDVAILTMPWPVLWRLQMSAQRKIAVTGIFLLGGVLVIAKRNNFFSVELIFIFKCHGCQYWKTRCKPPSG